MADHYSADATVKKGRMLYTPPKLQVLGDVKTLTAAGSGPGNEGFQNPDKTPQPPKL